MTRSVRQKIRQGIPPVPETPAKKPADAPHRPDVDANQPLSAVLTAEHWNVVIAGLHELPMKMSGLVYAALRPQLTAQTEPPMPPPLIGDPAAL